MTRRAGLRSMWRAGGRRGAGGGGGGGPTLPSEISVVCVGDSLTYGQGASAPGGATAYPAVLAGLLGLTAEVTAHNRGLPGNGSEDLPDVDYLLAAGKQNRLVVMIGTNDIFGGMGATASEVLARLSSYVAAREASGWLVSVLTPTAWLNKPGGTDAIMTSYCGLIRSTFDFVVDAEADTLIGNTGAGPDLVYYSDENGHLNDLGYDRLADLVFAEAAPTGPAPTITAAMGLERDASLTAWFRDMWRLDANGVTPQNPTIWHNLVESVVGIAGGRRAGQFDAFGSSRATRILNAINGKPALRFHGPGAGFFLPNDRVSADYLTTTEFVISVVLRVENITGTAPDPYDNDGVFSDAATRVGLCVSRQAGVPKATAFAYDGAFKGVSATITEDTDLVISVRMLAGKLGIRIGTAGAWDETPCGAIDTLANVFRIGTDSTNAKGFEGLIADVVIRDAWDTDRMAADDAYFAARYGV